MSGCCGAALAAGEERFGADFRCPCRRVYKGPMRLTALQVRRGLVQPGQHSSQLLSSEACALQCPGRCFLTISRSHRTTSRTGCFACRGCHSCSPRTHRASSSAPPPSRQAGAACSKPQSTSAPRDFSQPHRSEPWSAVQPPLPAWLATHHRSKPPANHTALVTAHGHRWSWWLSAAPEDTAARCRCVFWQSVKKAC
jgi:hypothetical protein